MSLGGGKNRGPEINVTPMIDVLLVLIIIFMVIIPMNSVGLKANIPQPSDQAAAPAEPSNDLVITVQGDRTVLLNQERVEVSALESRLKTLFAGLPTGRVIFIRADKDTEFASVAEVIDIARGAGLDHFALMSR